MAERGRFNLKQIAAPPKKRQPGRSQSIIEDIDVLGDIIFLLYRSYEEPRLEIQEFDSV